MAPKVGSDSYSIYAICGKICIFVPRYFCQHIPASTIFPSPVHRVYIIEQHQNGHSIMGYKYPAIVPSSSIACGNVFEMTPETEKHTLLLLERLVCVLPQGQMIHLGKSR